MPGRVIPLDTILPPSKVRDLHRAVTAVAKAQAALDAAKLEASALCLDAYEAADLKDTLRDFDRVAVSFLDASASFVAKEQPRRLRDVGRQLLEQLPKEFDRNVVAAVVKAATSVLVNLQRFRAELRSNPGARRPTMTVSSTCALDPTAKEALQDTLTAVDTLTDLLLHL